MAQSFLFKGSGVALVTPFKDIKNTINSDIDISHNDNQVNYHELERLIEWHIANQTDALIVCGTTGEASTLSETEKKALITFTVEKTNGRIPVIAGTGCNDTSDTIARSQFAEKSGADGLLIVTPYYNKCTQKGLIAHYTAIANAVNIPIILYNVPGRTNVNIAPETAAILAEHANIVGIKEASGDLSQIAKIASLCPKSFAIYSGNDDQIIPTLSLGGVGVISVLANIMPKETHDMVLNHLEGHHHLALDLQLGLLGLINSLFIEVNPIPVKMAMLLMGMQVGGLRLPLTEMEDATKKTLIKDMTCAGLL